MGNWLARLLARLVLQRLSVEMTMRAVCGKEEAVIEPNVLPLCFHVLGDLYGNATHSPVMGSKTTQTWGGVFVCVSSRVVVGWLARFCWLTSLLQGQTLLTYLLGVCWCSYLVDPASSHMLVSKTKPCMCKYKPVHGETANGSLNQLWFLRSFSCTLDNCSNSRANTCTKALILSN